MLRNLTYPISLQLLYPYTKFLQKVESSFGMFNHTSPLFVLPAGRVDRLDHGVQLLDLVVHAILKHFVLFIHLPRTELDNLLLCVPKEVRLLAFSPELWCPARPESICYRRVRITPNLFVR